MADLDAQQVDPAALGRALQEFTPLWEVMTVPERERVLALAVERVTYDGGTNEMKIEYRLAGMAELAAQVAS